MQVLTYTTNICGIVYRIKCGAFALRIGRRNRLFATWLRICFYSAKPYNTRVLPYCV